MTIRNEYCIIYNRIGCADAYSIVISAKGVGGAFKSFRKDDRCMARKKEESTNEKIVRLYKEGWSFDEIHKHMEIPKGNIIGIVEKYFPDYQTYVQPKRDGAPIEEKPQKSGRMPNVGGLFKRGGKDTHSTGKVTVNLEMDDSGFIDKEVQGIAKMLKNGKSFAEAAEFFNKEIADIQAVKELLPEHLKRYEASNAPKPAPKPVEEPKPTAFATGLEDGSTIAATKPKYVAPTYSKHDDPKPVSAAYGLADNEDAIIKPKEEGRVSLLDKEEKPATVDLLEQEEETRDIDLTAVIPETKDFDLVGESTKVEEPTVSLIGGDEEKKEEHKVSLLDSIEEIPEMPSIQPISQEQLEKELFKALEPEDDNIPEIGSAVEDNVKYTLLDEGKKEAGSGMTAMEKMKQFAQEQIALNNQKIDELKSKKTDAENNAFDCNTKVEAMKKEIEDMQAKLLVLIDEKDKAAKVVSDINDEIEAINKENSDYNSYL